MEAPYRGSGLTEDPGGSDRDEPRATYLLMPVDKKDLCARPPFHEIAHAELRINARPLYDS